MKNPLWKRLTAWFLCFALLTACLPGIVMGAMAADETTEASGDLLAGASAADTLGIFSGAPHSYDKNCTFVNGEDSLYSWKFSTTAEGTGWPTALLNLNSAVDMSGKYLAVDVYIQGGRDYLSVVSVYTSGWGSLNDAQWPPNYVQSGFGTEQWVTLYFDLTSALGADKDLTNVGLIKFCFDFETNAGNEQAVYLDNLRLVDEIPAPEPEPTEAPTEPEVTEPEITEPEVTEAPVEYPVDIELHGTSSVFTLQSDVTNDSEQAFVYNATSVPSHGWVYPSFTLDQTYDINDHMLIADVMITGDSDGSQVSLSTIDDKWPEVKFGTVKSGVWQKVKFNLATNASGKVDMSKFGFGIQLPGSSTDCVIYVDNIYLVPLETVEEDWILMNQDIGMNAGTNYYSPVVKAPDSSVSLKVVAPADAKAKTTFNTQAYFGSDNCPNMTVGTLGAWFYFGNAEPSAQLQLTASNWKSSRIASFEFSEGEDGWYYGTIRTSTLEYYDENADGQPDGNNESVIRLCIFTPQGSSVLIDGLGFEEGVEEPVEPEPTDPEPTEPEITEPEVTEAPTEPEVTEPEITEPEVTEAPVEYPVDIELHGTSSVFTLQSDVTNGSEQAFVYNAASVPVHGYVYPSITLDRTYDISDHMLIMDIMVTGDSDGSSLNLSTIDDKWPEIKAGTIKPDVWQKVKFDLSTNASGKTDMSKFGFGIQLPGSSTDCAIYIDNIYLVPLETVEEDWIIMSQDAGMSTGTTYYSPVVKAPDSSVSLKVVAPADAKAKTALNTEGYFGRANCPNMTVGTLGAWFYFGDAEPSAQLQLTASNWKGSRIASFEFSEGEDGWYYGTIRTSTLEYFDENADGQPDGNSESVIRLCIFTPQGSSVLIDGLGFEEGVEEPVEPEPTDPEPTEPEITEPEITEPEVTEAPTEPAPVDENDLLANSNNIVYNLDHWAEGTGLTIAPDTENITGEGSIRSWHISAEDSVDTNLAVAQFHLKHTYDMTGKKLAFDVKYVADTREQQAIGVRLHTSGWSNINDFNRTISINPGQWRTMVIDFTSVINADKDLSDLGLIAFHFDFSGNTGVQRDIYIDNVRLVTDDESQLIEDPLPEPQDENDMLGLTENISYNKVHWENVDNGNDADGNPIVDVTTGLTCGRDTENVIGEGSIRSWYFAATAEASFTPAVAQLRLAESYDLTGQSLVFDVKFESDDPDAIQTFFVRLHDSSWSDLVVERGVRVAQGGWHRIVLDFTESMRDGKDLRDVHFISFSFDFAANTGADRVVYIDNVQGIDTEDINEDFSNMTADSGMSSAPVFYHTTDKTWGENSQSLYVKTGTDAQVITLNAQHAVEQGALNNYLDMSSCIISGYFWFGDVTPAAKLSITEGSWAVSIYTPFTFEAVGDGWYYGTVNSHDIGYDDYATVNGADGSQVLRLSLMLPEDSEVYLDQFSITEIDPEPIDPHDLLGNLKYIVYNKDLWGATTGLSYRRDEEHLYGRDSIRSWSFHASSDATLGNAVAQFRLKQSYDMSGCTLLMDVYYASESPVAQSMGVRVHNSNWGNINDINRTFDVTANAWTTIVVDFSSVLNEGADLTDLRFISLYFDFAENTGYERTVYVDNVRLYRAETVQEDWVNMTQDSGAFYKNTETNITNDVDAIKAEGSFQGLYVKAPADTIGKVTFNTDHAANIGEIDAMPDLTSGILGAWFYFGDMEPYAYAVLTDFNWKGSRGVDFTFGESQNGWYYGTIDCSKFTYSETEVPGVTRRIMINVPAGFDGYIDGLTYTPVELPAELKFAGANLQLYYDLSLHFRAKQELFAEGMFTNPYVIFEFNGEKHTVYEYTLINDRYSFAFEHLKPQQINDVMNVTLYAEYNGTTVRSAAKEYSVAHYCYNMLDKTDNAELRTLLVDILNYGTEAQLAFNYNTAKLANANLTEEQVAMGTSTVPTIKTVFNLEQETVDAPEATWMGAGLVLENSIGIRYRFYAEDISNLSIVIKSNGKTWKITEFEAVANNPGYYYAYFNDLNATQMQNKLDATIYRGDIAISNTVRYSIQSYLYEMQDHEQFGALIIAIARYGISARNYIY